MTNSTEAAFVEEAKEPATQQIRMDLAVEAIVKAENLEVSDEEVEAEYKNLSEKYNMDVDTVKKYLHVEQIKEQVIREKAIKVVADSAVAVAPEEDKSEESAEDEEAKTAKKSAKKAEEPAESK